MLKFRLRDTGIPSQTYVELINLTKSNKIEVTNLSIKT